MRVICALLRSLLYLLTGKAKGYCVKQFCINCGSTYIKLGQILAMQNYNDLFNEKDQQDLLTITDDCVHIPYREIRKVLVREYGDLSKVFKKIYSTPVGTASVSQVHKAVLLNGETVAVKVKRQDIERRVHADIRNIKICMRLFGKLFGFYNFVGGKTALTYLEDWILEELDFRHEAYNIQRYTKFANTVNGKITGCRNIVLPKIYRELCTANVIIMEFVPYRTLSKGVNADDVLPAMDTYVRLSFYALLHHLPVVWHGDPHAGNIYIDDCGNVGFLDMGLLFELTEHEADLCLQLFFSAYLQRKEKLFTLISPWLEDKKNKDAFYEELDIYVKNIPQRPITNYFMDLVFVCMRVHINPPRWLYNMAKAFVCLNGIDSMYFNQTTGRELLLEQVVEYLATEGTEAVTDLGRNCVKAALGAVLHDNGVTIPALTQSARDIGRILKLL